MSAETEKKHLISHFVTASPQGEAFEKTAADNVYSAGVRVTIPENSRIIKNIVLDDESMKVRRRDTQAYKNVEMLAQDLGMRVKYVRGLTDSAGTALDGVITSQGIFINSEAENPSRFVATHEFSHRMKQVSPKQWQKYQEFVIKRLQNSGRYENIFNKKAAAYKNSNTDYINEEIAADYIGELFGNETELAELIKESRRDAVTIRDIWYGILDKLGLLDEKKKAQLMWRNAYKAAMKSVEEGSAGEFTGEVKYSKEYTFNKQVDDALANRIKRGFSVYVGKLPKLLEKCGLNPELPMLMHPSHIRDINHEKSEDNIHYHGISDEVIKQIPELLKYPAMIYDSISEDNRENSICVLTTQCDSEGAPIIIVITNSTEKGRYLDVKMEVQKISASNHVDTMYGKDGFSYHMDSVIDQDAVLYVSKDGFNKLLNRKNLRLNSDGKLRLLARLDNLRFDTIIHQSNNVVNTNSMQKVENDAKKSISGARISDIEGESATLAEQATPHPSAMPTPSPQGEGLTPKGRIKPGAEPRRDVVVPGSMKKGTKVRQFARTAAEAETLSEETAEGVLENVEQGKFSYTPLSDKKAMNYAYSAIDTMGMEWAEDKVNGAITTHSLDKNTVALAEVLMQRYSEEGQQERVQELIINFAAESTRMGQSIQAISMLKKLDKNYEIAYIDKIVENLKEDIVRMNGKKLFGGQYSTDIEVAQELKTKLREAKTELEREEVCEQIYTQLAEQLPVRWIDRWNAWRYFAMLANARTHVRNLLGNTFFMPMIGAKNVAAKLIEPIADFISGRKMERSKTFIVPKKYRQFAAADAKAMRDMLTSGGKHNPTGIIKGKQKMFIQPFEWMRIENEKALEFEDWLFLKKHYATALSNYLAANKIDLDNMDEETLDRARYRAVQEAQRNTYRDMCAFANTLSKLSKANAPAALLVEGLMPFKKTPINVLKRGVEYSPVGLVKVLSYDIAKVTKGEITASEYIDRLCASLTGTGVVALGMLLGSLGYVVGSSDDDKQKEFEELQGVQNYSLVIGEHSYTLDWLAPFALPFFVGVELQRMLEDGEGITFRELSKALSNITEPIFEMSMLQGISSAVSTINNAKSAETYGQIFSNAAENYFGQAVPTLFGQVARTVDDTQRKSYDDKNIDIPQGMQYFAQAQMKKIPGASKKLEPYVDAWGRKKVTDGIFKRALLNMLSPGYYSKIESSDMEEELKRLYDAVGDEDSMKLFPSKADNKFKLDNDTEKNLSAKEYSTMQTVQGQTAYTMLSDILESEVYGGLDDVMRGKIVTKVYDFARANARKSVAKDDWTGDKWVEEALSLIDGEDFSAAEDYVIYQVLKNETSVKEARAYAFDKLEDIPDSVWQGQMSEAATREYEEHIKDSDITVEEYVAARDYKGSLKTINKDTPQEITPKEQMIEYIEGLDMTNDEKRRLYLSVGYSAKTCPW